MTARAARPPLPALLAAGLLLLGGCAPGTGSVSPDRLDVSAGATAANFAGPICGADESKLLIANSTDHEVDGECSVTVVKDPDGTTTTTTSFRVKILSAAAAAQQQAYAAIQAAWASGAEMSGNVLGRALEVLTP